MAGSWLIPPAGGAVASAASAGKDPTDADEDAALRFLVRSLKNHRLVVRKFHRTRVGPDGHVYGYWSYYGDYRDEPDFLNDFDGWYEWARAKATDPNWGRAPTMWELWG